MKKILLSGYRATVVMEEGKALDEEKTKKAITGKNLSFEGFEKLTKLVPEAGYQIKVKGAG